MLVTLFFIAAMFALLFVGRVGAARRLELMRRWPAIVLAGAAIYALSRGAVWPATLLAVATVLAWQWWPRWRASLSRQAKEFPADPADAEAQAILGVGPDATAGEIRAAYRAKMARAHPDRGGSNAEAARLTAARDRLLGKAR